MRIRLFILLSLLFVRCSSTGVPSDVIAPEKMKLIIYDLLRADEFVNNNVLKDTSLKRDVEAKKYYQQVFIIHNTNRKEFFSSYNYYQSHPDKNKLLFDSINTFANRRRNGLIEKVK